jgi:hypothetical protein
MVPAGAFSQRLTASQVSMTFYHLAFAVLNIWMKE